MVLICHPDQYGFSHATSKCLEEDCQYFVTQYDKNVAKKISKMH